MPAEEITIARLETALAAVCYAIARDGATYAPLMARLEAEIAARRAGEDVVARARRHLERLRDQAGVKQIA
jgi:hypothetical protein